MFNEHFGIGIVEFMAAGLIPLANKSGGPSLDILKPFHGKTTGYLADSETSYVEALTDIFNLSSKEKMEVQKYAREAANELFSEVKFMQTIHSLVIKFFE